MWPRKKKKILSRNDEIFSEVLLRGKKFQFLITHPLDHIQMFHASGQFYDLEELNRIECHLGENRLRVVDVGANVGNHTVYMAHFFGCERIIPIEPNAEILRTLKANIGLNWHASIEPRLLGLGLSDRSSRAKMNRSDLMNIGGTSVDVSAAGEIDLVRGDELFANECIQFFKIDVEGHELMVLEGLRETISKNRPVIYIETRTETRDAVIAFMKQRNYTTAFTYCRYEGVINHMFDP